jgi:MPBQ/MSBQ methyltransferase
MSPDTRHLTAWDTDYRRRGRLWGGNPTPVPELPDGSRVLELGCGNGKNLPGMIGKGWDITAMDCSKNALQLCHQVVHKTGQVLFVVGDAVYLPFRDSAYEAVFSLHIAGHLTEPGRVHFAGEVARVLKPGGQIMFRDFGIDDFRCGKGEETEQSTFRRGTGSFTHYFTENEVNRLFRALNCISIDNHRWSMKVKGHDYPRSEITAIFEKPA